MDQFALKIAFLNALAYIYPVLMATYVDSLIHHVTFGPRYYWMGYGVALGSILIFILTYIFNIKIITTIYSKIDYSAQWRTLFTFLSLYIPIIFVLIVNFGPEFPHMAISTNSLGYGLMIASIVYVHEYKQNSVNNNKYINEYILVERLKLEHMTWLAVTIGLLISFIFFCLVLYSIFPDLSRQYTNYPQEQILLFNSFVLDLFMAIIFSIFAFIELFARIQYTKNQLMRSPTNDNM